MKHNLELQWPEWKTFNLDKLTHLWGALEEKESWPRTQKGRGKIIFLPLQFLIIQMGPAGTPFSLWSLQMGSWENWWKLTKGKNSYQSQLSGSLSVVLGWERDVKSHIVPSFPNSDSCEFSFGVPIDYQFFPSQGPPLLSFVLFCVLAFLPLGHAGGRFLCVQAAQPSGLGSQYGWIGMWVALHLQ